MKEIERRRIEISTFQNEIDEKVIEIRRLNNILEVDKNYIKELKEELKEFEAVASVIK